MKYNFEWDPHKAKQNIQKHGISFDRAAKVFLDAFAISVFDDEHSNIEDRWITIGSEYNDLLVVVVHTFKELDSETITIRIVSARKATREEAQQYHER